MSVVESIVNDFIQWTYTVYVTFNNPRREWDGTLTPVVAILLPTPHCALALAFRHLPEPCLRAVRFKRPCSIDGLYIFTDTGTADREVLLYVNVLKNTFGGTDIDTDFADTHNCSHNPYSWTSLRIASL